jgi:hypothetical protein
MSRRKSHRSSRRKFPLLTALAISATVGNAYLRAAGENKLLSTLNNVAGAYTGFSMYQGNWDAKRLLYGWGPLAAVVGIKFATRLVGVRLPTIGPVAMR